ncbi:MAG: radical SAM family heme chaperone HemW [Pseudomonadota bacterium]
MSLDIPLSLYVHFPWCVRKCPYCDFNSHASGDGIDEDRYVAALLADIEAETAAADHRAVISVFIGGGTPSLLSGRGFRRLLQGVRERVNLVTDAEITLEANPGALDESHFSAYRDAGANRLSIGVQSFDDSRLQAIGRIHDGAMALEAVRMARTAGFDNLNLDLMFGLPGQRGDEALADLAQAIELKPEHLSWYQLTIEPNTPFHHEPPAGLPDDDELGAMHFDGMALLAGAGYRQYEVSAFAQPGRECRHNLNYWQFGDYLGVGAGAHGKVTLEDGRVTRCRKQRQPEAFMRTAEAGDACSSRECLQDDDLFLEFMMNALRLNNGVPVRCISERTGLAWEAVRSRIAPAVTHGLMVKGEERLQATPLGLRYLNNLLAMFA